MNPNTITVLPPCQRMISQVSPSKIHLIRSCAGLLAVSIPTINGPQMTGTPFTRRSLCGFRIKSQIPPTQSIPSNSWTTSSSALRQIPFKRCTRTNSTLSICRKISNTLASNQESCVRPAKTCQWRAQSISSSAKKLNSLSKIGQTNKCLSTTIPGAGLGTDCRKATKK